MMTKAMGVEGEKGVWRKMGQWTLPETIVFQSSCSNCVTMLSCRCSSLSDFDFSSCVDFQSFKFATGELETLKIFPSVRDILIAIHRYILSCI